MNYDFEIQQLKEQVNNLIDTVMTMAQRNVSDVAKADDTANQVKAITPYTETKTAYIGDTEVIFTDIKDGNLSVFVKDENGNYPDFSVDRNGDIITVYFEPLEYITTITISIQ